MKIPVSSFLSYLWSYLAYRDVLYIKLKLLRFCFDLMLSFLAPGSIFVEQLRQEVVSFVFRVAQTVFVPNFYIPLIWQLFFFFFMNFFILRKGTDAYDFTKKKIVYLIPFHKTEFSNSFCQRFFYPVFIFYSQHCDIYLCLQIQYAKTCQITVDSKKSETLEKNARTNRTCFWYL